MEFEIVPGVKRKQEIPLSGTEEKWAAVVAEWSRGRLLRYGLVLDGRQARSIEPKFACTKISDHLFQVFQAYQFLRNAISKFEDFLDPLASIQTKPIQVFCGPVSGMHLFKVCSRNREHTQKFIIPNYSWHDGPQPSLSGQPTKLQWNSNSICVQITEVFQARIRAYSHHPAAARYLGSPEPAHTRPSA
jgi:hypothetical protein